MRRLMYILLVMLQVIALFGCKAKDASQADLPKVSATETPMPLITVDGKQRQLADTALLVPGYTQENLVQFRDFYDFGLFHEQPLGFSGEISLNGEPLKDTEYRFDGYPDKALIVLKLFYGRLLTDSVLRIGEGSTVYYGEQAVVIKETFHALWDGEKWIITENGGTI